MRYARSVPVRAAPSVSAVAVTRYAGKWRDRCRHGEFPACPLNQGHVSATVGIARNRLMDYSLLHGIRIGVRESSGLRVYGGPVRTW
jgi:hypothetical protein